ncbi:biotin/lipoyl-containing protein, partial [Verminephrobacter eiseniae]
MATEVILPRVDMDMAEGKIACWYVKNGDQVRKGQVLFDIETDKATMEVEAPASGVIDSIDGAIGVTMPVGQVVAWIRAPGAARVEGTSAPPAARQAAGTAATAAVPEPGHATAMSPPAP